jgi:hypothetical protein
MVTRYRLRSALLNLALWLFAAGVVGYFAYHAFHGQRGIEAQRNFEVEIATLKSDLSRLEQQRHTLEAKVAPRTRASVRIFSASGSSKPLARVTKRPERSPLGKGLAPQVGAPPRWVVRILIWNSLVVSSS